MNELTDLERRLASWLADGPRAGSRDLLAATLDDVRRTGQQPAWLAGVAGSTRGLGPARARGASASRAAALFLLAVAGALTLLAAAQLVGAPDRLSVRPTARPSPAVEPSPRLSQEPSLVPNDAPPPYTDAAGGFRVSPPHPARWHTFIYEPATVGDPSVTTFPDGGHVSGDVWTHFIVVAVGTSRAGAIVGTEASPGATDPGAWPMVRVWAPDAGQLAAAYVEAVGGRIDPEPVLLGGEPAVRIAGGRGVAETIVAVHRDRAYVLSTTAFMRTQPAPHWTEFVDTFAFVDP